MIDKESKEIYEREFGNKKLNFVQKLKQAFYEDEELASLLKKIEFSEKITLDGEAVAETISEVNSALDKFDSE